MEFEYLYPHNRPMKAIRFKLSSRTHADAARAVEKGDFDSVSDMIRHAVRVYDERLRRGEIPPILHLAMADPVWITVRVPEAAADRVTMWAGLARGEVAEYALRSYIDDWVGGL